MLNFTLLLVVGGEEADLNEACRVVYTAAARSTAPRWGSAARAGVSRPFHKLHHMQLAAQEAWEACACRRRCPRGKRAGAVLPAAR